MKKAVYVSLLGVLLVMMGGCTEEGVTSTTTEVPSARVGSSYYGVNYTDSGHTETLSETVSIKPESERSSVSSKAETKDSSAASKPSSAVSSASSGMTQSTTSTSTTITYYYPDGTVEEEIIVPDTDTSEESSSAQTSETEPDDSDTASSSDTVSDTSSDSSEASDTDSSAPTEIKPLEDSDFIFEYKELKISYGMDMVEIRSALDDPIGVDTIPYDHGSGYDITVYYYEDFTIIAYPQNNGTVYIADEIQIFDTSIATARGIYVGMSAEDVEKAYGTKDQIICRDKSDTCDQYRYYSGDTYIYFNIQNDVILNIGFGYEKSESQAEDSDQ